MALEELKKGIKEHDLDFTEEIFRRGVVEGAKHSIPSPETLSRLNKIEETMLHIMNSFDEHAKNSEKRIEEIVLEFREGMKDVKAIQEFLSNASFLKKFLIGGGSFIAFVGGTYLLFRDIFHGNN
jgi:hypothetical protein